MTRTLRVAALSAVATVVAVLGFAGAAGAHVTVSPGSAVAGGDARIALRVPDESDTASTVKIEMAVPTDQPIPSVSVEPVPGWTVSTDTTKLATPVKTEDGDTVTQAVSKITWTASADGAIRPGQFQEFPVALESLPDTDKIVFKTIQTYSDGTIVRWIDDTVEGQPEPDHPAPVLTLAKGGDTAPVAIPPGAATPGGVAVAEPKPDRSGLAWGIAGAVLGLTGTVLGALALRRNRRPAGHRATG
jgi:periplasmic copper chaperone A